MKKDKKYDILIIIGIILLLVAFFLNIISLIRIIIAVVGLLCLIIEIIINHNNKLYYKILAVFLVTLIIYCIDYCSFTILKRLPIFITEIVSSEKMSTYNSLIYRIYNCNGELIHDKGYKKSYVCGDDNLNAVNINDFLTKPQENFNQYKNKFIKLTGKISTISGENELELEKYIKDAKNTLNGYVLFNDTYIVRTTLSDRDSLKNSRIYDEVIIIGRISSMKKINSQYIINLEDSKMYPNKIYSNFVIETQKNNDSSKVLLTDNYYMTGLEHFYIKYDENNIYDLKYALLDKRVTLNNFTDIDINSVKNNTLIKKDNYNILICQNKDILFGSEKLTKNNINCPEIESSEE